MWKSLLSWTTWLGLRLSWAFPTYYGGATIAQSTPGDPLSGGAGWVGAGLLGLVLAWLMLKHLPDKDKQLKELTEAKDKQIQDLIVAKDGQITSMLATKNEQLKQLLGASGEQSARMHEENQKSMDRVIAHCKDEMSVTNQILQHDLRELGETIDRLTQAVGQIPRRRLPPHSEGG